MIWMGGRRCTQAHHSLWMLFVMVRFRDALLISLPISILITMVVLPRDGLTAVFTAPVSLLASLRSASPLIHRKNDEFCCFHGLSIWVARV